MKNKKYLFFIILASCSIGIFIMALLVSFLVAKFNLNLLNHSLSDLGTISKIFNYCLIIAGLLLAGFLRGFNMFFEKGHSLGSIFLFLASAALVLIGFFPKESSYHLHSFFSFLFFFLFPLSLIFFSQKIGFEKLKRFTLSCCFFFVFIWLLYFLIRIFIYPLGLALPEIVSFFIVFIWISFLFI